MSRDVTRMLFISDPHCGHRGGLTPPPWQMKMKKSDGFNAAKLNKLVKAQGVMWNLFDMFLDNFRPYDVIGYVGDGIDGRGEKSGGTELITTNLDEQTDIAIEVMNHVKFKSRGHDAPIYGVYGTGYHTGNYEDHEDKIAREVGFKSMESRAFLDVNGFMIDMRHHVGSSQASPHGQATGLGTSMSWGLAWAADKLQPKVDVFVRGHAHSFQWRENQLHAGLICPCLKGFGDKFGARRCQGLVTWGLVCLDLNHKTKEIICRKQFASAPTMAASVREVQL